MAHENSEPQGPPAPSGGEKKRRGRPKKTQPGLRRRNIALTEADEIYLMRGVARMNGFRDFAFKRNYRNERISASWVIRALLRYFEEKTAMWDPRSPESDDLLVDVLLHGIGGSMYRGRLQKELDKAIATVSSPSLWDTHPDKLKAREFLDRLVLLHSSDLNELKLKLFPE